MSQINPLVQNMLWEYRPSLKKKDAIQTTANIDSKSELKNTEWRDTYSLVCNLANLNPTKIMKPNAFSKFKISELQRLCIAVQMTGVNKPTSSFLYKPKHLAYNELCMVVSPNA